MTAIERDAFDRLTRLLHEAIDWDLSLEDEISVRDRVVPSWRREAEDLLGLANG